MHKPEVKAFVMALIMAGALFAQGVAITQPLDGLITSDVNQRVTYVFADPGAVDVPSIVLNVDGTDYTVGDPEITWSTVNFHYDVDPEWTEGMHELAITAEDTTTAGGGGGGDRGPIAGSPLETIFYVDASGPYMDARTPGMMGEAEPFTTTDVFQPITIDIIDDLGYINIATIEVLIDGVVYGNGDLGGNSVQRVYDVINARAKQFRNIFRRNAHMPRVNCNGGINGMYARRHHVHFAPADGVRHGVQLSVDIGEAYRVVVRQQKSPDAASGERLHGITAHAANAQHGDGFCPQGFQRVAANKQFRTRQGMLLCHIVFLNARCRGAQETFLKVSHHKECC